MAQRHTVTPTEIGMIRIYLKPSDKVGTRPRAFWSGKALYRELVAQAKQDGIMNAVAHQTHYGFSNYGSVRENGAEASDPHLTMCVELIGHRQELERFCERHGRLLADKVVVYKHLEHWKVRPSEFAGEVAVPD
jgi:PII-like signaling protein